MKRTCALLLFIALALCSQSYCADSIEGGTSAEELVARTLAAPSTIKVAIMPLYDYASNSHHQHVGSAACYLEFEHEGFEMVPLLLSFAAEKNDGKIEPGLPMRKEDAVRIGNVLAADWVVYGEIKEMRDYKVERWYGDARKIQGALRLCVADCKTGELIYWKAKSDNMGETGGFVERKASQLIRVATQAITRKIFAALFKVLPKHDTKGPLPNDLILLDLEKKTWNSDNN